MPKKKKVDISINHPKLLEMIDDQIFKHLPIPRIIEIMDERIALAIKPKTKTKKAA